MAAKRRRVAKQSLVVSYSPKMSSTVTLLLTLTDPTRFGLLNVAAMTKGMPLTLARCGTHHVYRLTRQFSIPIFTNYPHPVIGSPIATRRVRNRAKLSKTVLPRPALPLRPPRTISFLVGRLRDTATPIALTALNPLAGLTITLVRCPSVTTIVRRIIIVKNTLNLNGIAPTTRFGVCTSPRTTQMIVRSNLPVALLNLSIARRILAAPTQLDTFRQLNAPINRTITSLLHCCNRTRMRHCKLPNTPLRSPYMVTCLLTPRLFAKQLVQITVRARDTLYVKHAIVSPCPATDATTGTLILRATSTSNVCRLLLRQLTAL